jgi:triosephosphate isomerase
MRRPIFAANWKMHKNRSDAAAYVRELLPRVVGVDGVDIVLAPPFTALDAVAAALAGSAVALAAQNVHPAASGAFTGEVAPGMLADLGCRFGIVGHSERRALFGETDAFVASKAAALLDAGLRPIVCIGETLEQRDAGQTFDVLRAQIAGSLAGLPVDCARDLVLAYEPVWAIGTGRSATPEMAQEAHAFVRERLVAEIGETGAGIQIQYGGSVKPENAAALMAQPDIDGALVGGAGLEAESFSKIIRFEAQEGSS